MTTLDDTAPDPIEPGSERNTRKILMRGVTMVIVAVFFGFAEALLALIVLTQFFWLLITRRPNDALKNFGHSLSAWFSQAARFQACDTDQKPFPWSPWPSQ